MTLNMGWIGCGRHATQMLLPQLARAGMRIGALCDVNENALTEAAAQFGVKRTTTDWQELVAMSGLDALCMAVGPDIHHKAAMAAIDHGLPVFMEKPPAADHARTLEIAQASSRTGIPVFVGFMKRYSTANKMAGNILRGDEFGPVHGITGTYMTAPTYFEGEPDFTGFYLHHCIHYMDLMPWLAGSPLEDMDAHVCEAGKGKLLIHLGFSCASGAIGTIVMGTIQSRGTPMEAITVMGDHQRLEMTNVINLSWFRNPPFKADYPDAILDSAQDTLAWTPNFTAAANEDHKGYQALLVDVAKSITSGRTTAPTIADGAEAMKWLDRMRNLVEAARSNSHAS